MYEGIDGFLGTRASLMLDVVFLAMFLVVPVLFWNIWQVRKTRRYTLHKQIQTALAAVLLIAVAAFELDMRMHGWEERATKSPATAPSTAVYTALYIHLVFAVSTFAAWVVVVWQAYRRFPKPPAPGEHSKTHRRWGYFAALDMLMTAVTGWIFYVIAFVL